MARFAAAVCLALAMLALCNGQIPSFTECDATFNRIGEDSLTSTLTPCAVGDTPSAECCNAIAGLTDVGGGGELAGCLCQQQVIDGVVGVLEGNALAMAVGFDGARLNSVLSQCGADVVGTSNCQQSTTPPGPEETPSFEVTETPAPPAEPKEPIPSATTESTFEVTTTPAPPAPEKKEPAPPVPTPSLPTPPGKLPPRPKATAKVRKVEPYEEQMYG
ncbi:unnamed protein product [Ostreobium quekettii]|uniref:Bifunctional inhibitor/plant lipid transfer protein/seed storage helical domain-containing protein n=1 Tax=Ostreobium quekettii TaxID=121088 RepID=A0A8S1JBG5_9CHLO|nr:unnamed protein product [Ostreobium quekettii]